MNRNRFFKMALMLLVAAGAGGAAAADAYPTKPIRLIVPFGPGASADILTRRVAKELDGVLGQSIVVENRQGAGGIVGTDLVAKAAPDGYTLGVGTISTHAMNAGLYKALPYQPVRNFTPVSRIGAFSNVLVVPTSLGVTNMKQLIDLAKRSDKPLTYSSPGTGTTLHLQGEMLQRTAGVKLLHVPYADMGTYLPDLVSGRTDMSFGNLPHVLPFIKSGKLVPVAISTPQRSPLLPNVPTMAEAGFESMEMAPWIAIFAPAGTPADVVEKLNKAINAVLQKQTIRDAYMADGITPTADPTAAGFATFHRREADRWVKVIEEADIPKQ